MEHETDFDTDAANEQVAAEMSSSEGAPEGKVDSSRADRPTPANAVAQAPIETEPVASTAADADNVYSATECTGDVSNDDVVQDALDEEQVEHEDEDGADTQERSRLPLLARVSSLLFVSTKPLSAEQLAEASGSRQERVEEALEQLRLMFEDQVHGFSLQSVAGAWQFRTAPAAATYVHRLIPKTARKLSRAAAETLAVVAYKQPVQRAEIEAIRGVDALPTLKTLLDAKLIRIVGREQTAGQPALYGTTKTFLEKFGLADLSELPSAKELAQFLDEPGEVDEENTEPSATIANDDAERVADSYSDAEDVHELQ